MEYQKVSSIIDDAWHSFYNVLATNGFTEEQVRKFAKELNYGDVFNGVEKCAMEAVR
jgi:hypothetical protein